MAGIATDVPVRRPERGPVVCFLKGPSTRVVLEKCAEISPRAVKKSAPPREERSLVVERRRFFQLRVRDDVVFDPELGAGLLEKRLQLGA